MPTDRDDAFEELIGLWAEGALPDGLKSLVEQRLAADPDAAADAHSLRETISRLRRLPSERPDPWFVDRALLRLLREHDAAEEGPRLVPRHPQSWGKK